MKPIVNIKVPGNIDKNLSTGIINAVRSIKEKMSEDYYVTVLPANAGIKIDSIGTVINVTLGKDLIKDFSELNDKLDELRELTKTLKIEGGVNIDTSND